MTSYCKNPKETFWQSFPKNELPREVIHSVNVAKFGELLKNTEKLLTVFEKQRAERCLVNFTKGASSCQKFPLPACKVENSVSALEFGKEVTDTVVTWIKKGYVAGPFDGPPLPMFRINALKAVDQGVKIRPVLNVSLPAGFSFNDNIKKNSMEKVYMSNAKRFGYSVCEAGVNAKMSKFDLVDAYKIIPAPICDLRLQGFQWLGKNFVECRQIFGAKTAVANFDIVGNTVRTLTCAISNIPRKLVHRTLDDVPLVSPVHKNWCEQFSDNYVEICKSIGVEVAKDCPKLEKAFQNSTKGKVLGIFFDTTKLSWTLPEEKRAKALKSIQETLSVEFLSLTSFQSLMGRLNDVSQMCPFLRGFKSPLNKLLGKLESGKNVRLSHEAGKDLQIWKNFLMDPDVSVPICPKYSAPPLSYKSFCSDAAGLSATTKVKGRVGCGNVGFSFDGQIIFAYQLLWTNETLQYARDNSNKRLGDKTTALEFLGIIVPFLVIPEQLMGQHIVVKVDNIGCFYGWINRQVSGDEIATILVRTLHIIEAFLGSRIHIEHLPRKKHGKHVW